MKQSVEKVVTAVAITALKSLRAATNKGKGKIHPLVETINGELQVAVSECPDLCPAWTRQGGRKLPCVRRGSAKGARTDIKPWWQVAMSKGLGGARVFKVELSPDRAEAWPKSRLVQYVVAYDLAYVKKLIKDRYDKIVKRYSGLGRDAWSRAMMLVSDRPANFISTPKAKKVLDGHVAVRKQKGDGRYGGTVHDNLRYAGKALKGGDNAVNEALMKAANSVNANINNYIESHQKRGDWFDESSWPKEDAPFPPGSFGE